MSFLIGLRGHKRLFDTTGGWSVEDFLSGFPRVFFGFSCSMLIYRRYASVPCSGAICKRNVSPWVLYGMLIAVLIFPARVQGAYGLFALAGLAPALVWFGSFSASRSRFTTALSEFLGWLSYPLYCMHMPVLLVGQWLYKTTDINRLPVPERGFEIVLALITSVVVGLLADRLAVQKKLYDVLRSVREIAISIP